MGRGVKTKFFMSSQMVSNLAPRLRLRGLPFEATLADVLKFFNGFTLLEDPRMCSPVDFITHSDGRPTGQAFVYFPETAEAQRAHRHLHRTYMGERWVEMYVDHR